MPAETLFLKLYKKQVGDKDHTFNITQMLNDNWDKIDAQAKAVSDEVHGLGEAVISLGTQVSSGAKMTDTTTHVNYKWGVENGKVYIEEVS